MKNLLAVYMDWNAQAPFIMAFIKFAILASLGESLAVRIQTGNRGVVPGWKRKAIVWGFLGMGVAWVFPIYAAGVASLGFSSTLLTAFLTSLTMNLSFGPVLMVTHRISDTRIELKEKGQLVTAQAIFDANDWLGFFRFALVKTNLFFWIPMHTVTFLLPPVWRLLMAAMLSMALGILLAFARRR